MTLRALRGWTASMLLLLPVPAAAQAGAPPRDPPRLVVVLVVDQLRTDYLDRFRTHFGEGGFNRFFRDGASLARGEYEHAATKTCVGHAVVATGTHTFRHGIIANEWYNPARGAIEYCARDPDARILGGEGEGRSPRNLLVPTLGDALRLHTGGRSRVVSVAGKDRSAIMLGGRLAESVYWVQDSTFVTSTYYRSELPGWVRAFNAAGPVTRHFGATWERVLPAEAYAFLGHDDEPGERDVLGLGRSFPHRLGAGETEPGARFFEQFDYTPFYNEMVVEFAMEAVRNEGLGRGEAPDLLGLALSANDHIGHAFGPDSHEVLDVTVRTDRLLERLFAFLDGEVGLDRTVVVLTGDHGVAPLPEAVARLNPASGARRIHPREIRGAAEDALSRRYGPAPSGRWVASHGSPNLFLAEALLHQRGIPLEEAEEVAREAVERLPGIFAAHTRSALLRQRAQGARSDVLLSFHPDRSGHVMYFTAPYAIEVERSAGTTHGSPWTYDRRVPVLFLGPGVRAGTYQGRASVADIAPTLAALLGTDAPAASEGRVLTEILKQAPAETP